MLLLAGSLSACNPLPAPALEGRHPAEGKHDLEYSARHELRVLVQGDPGRVRVTHATSVTLVPLRPFMLRRAFYDVTVPWHTSMKGLRAYRSGQRFPSGHVRDLLPSLPNVFLHSTRLMRVFSPSRRLGETLTYQYTQAHEDLRFLPILPLPNVDYVKRFEVVVHHPASVGVELRWWARDGVPAPALTRSIAGDQATSRIVLQNLVELPARPWDPLSDPRALVWINLSRGGEPLHPVTPAAFTRWIRGLFDGARGLGADGEALARRLVTGLGTDRERARALYDFVRLKVRYIADVRGMGAIVPRPAATVLARRWGDCKDKTSLLVALGRQIGLAMDPVLVATEERPPMEGVIHPGMFNHAIASVRLGDGRVFMDPTATSVPFGSLPTADQDAVALVLDPAAPTSLRLPVGGAEPEISGSITFAVGEPPRARAVLSIGRKLRNEIALWWPGPGQEGWEERMAALLTDLLPELRFSALRLIRTSAEAYLIEAEVDAGRLVLGVGPRLYLRRTPRPPCPPGLEERGRDRAPLLLPPSLSVDLTMRFPSLLGAEAPALGALAAATRVVRKAGGLAWFESHAEGQGGAVTMRVRQGHARRYLTGKAKETYLRFCAEVRADAQGWFVLGRAR